MIKVLHIHTLPVISGSGINTFLTMHGLDPEVYNVELACAPGGRLISLVRDHHMTVRTINGLVQPLHPLKDLLALLRLIRLMKKQTYQIVHTHNSKAGFTGRLAARLAAVPVIVHTVHGFAFHDQEPPWRQALFRNLERIATRWCDQMIFISQPLIDWALTERIADQDQIVKIYSGLELEKFTPVKSDLKKKLRTKWHIGQNDPVVGIVSKLWEGKGHSQLIEAFREIKRDVGNAKLVIVGEGYLQEKLLKQIDRLSLRDDVLFTGFQMDIREILGTFDVAVLPSFFEGMGRVLLEAMAMEKPVVASDVGGIPDLVKDGINGYLVPPGNVRELAGAIKKLLLDKRLARKMGQEGRRRIKEEFSAKTMVQSIDQLYRQLLAMKGFKIAD
ncbi:glycosyltransferase family 4 protein [Thermodesulfobacteriota bacterium]